MTVEEFKPLTDSQAAALLKGFDAKARSLLFQFAKWFYEMDVIPRELVESWFFEKFPDEDRNRYYAWLSAIEQRAQRVIGRSLIKPKKQAVFVEEDGRRRRTWRTVAYEGNRKDFEGIAYLSDPLWSP